MESHSSFANSSYLPYQTLDNGHKERNIMLATSVSGGSHTNYAISSVFFFFGPCACNFAALYYICGQQREIILISLPYKDGVLIIIL